MPFFLAAKLLITDQFTIFDFLQEDVESAVEVYKEFLMRYPYCYGYWKKYADYLKKRSTLEEAEKVRFNHESLIILLCAW